MQKTDKKARAKAPRTDELRAYQAAYARAWRAEHPERAKANAAAFRAAHRERLRIRQREYVHKNREAVKVSARARRLANPELIREQKRASYIRNRDAISEKGRICRQGWSEEKKEKERHRCHAKWIASTPEQRRAGRLRREHGLSIADCDSMLAAQGGVCAICGTATPDGRNKCWHVDHDHDTHQVRGLLCSRCNHGLGLFGDSPENLRAAALYLEDAYQRLAVECEKGVA